MSSKSPLLSPEDRTPLPPLPAGGQQPEWKIVQVKKSFGRSEYRLEQGGKEYICSIRVRKLQEKEAGEKPKLGWLKKKYWVHLKVEGKDVLVNIDSIVKRTGLTETQIRGKEGLELKNLLTDAMKESVNLALGIKSELTIEKSGPSSFLVRGARHGGKRTILDKHISDALGLTEKQVRQARKDKKISETWGQDSEGHRTLTVTFKIEAPVGEKLQEMVADVYAFQKKTMAAKKREGTRVYSPMRKWRWKSIISLSAYVTPEGEVYLSSTSKKIGSGGFKDIWRGIKASTREEVAIAIVGKIPKGQVEETGLLEMAQGPGICEYHTCFKIGVDSQRRVTAEAGVGMIMKYYNGGSLEDYIKNLKEKPLGERVAIQALIMHKLAEALNHLHNNKGMVHCDIKTANILLATDNQGNLVDVVLADFGISQVGQTNSGGVKGTFEYLSPHQMKWGDGSMYSDDIWTLGMSFLEMINPELLPFYFSSLHFLWNKDAGLTDLTDALKAKVTSNDLEDVRGQLESQLESDPTYLLLEYRTKKTPEERYSFAEPYGGIDELRKNFEQVEKSHFDVRRPTAELEPAGIPNFDDLYKLIQKKMEILCWDMLFSNPKMKTAEVFERAKQIWQETEAVQRRREGVANI